MAEDTKTAEPNADSGAAPPGGDPPAEPSADQPGRPLDSDIDPELVALPRPPRKRVGPVLAASVIVFCGYILLRLYDDVRFARQPDEPRAFASVAELLDSAQVEQLVRVPAVPDRAFAVKVAHSIADEGSRLAPVQGSNGELWIMLGGNVWTAGIRYEEVYTGRLRRIADLPFAEELRAHVRARGAEPRFLPPSAVRQALEDRATALRDPAGDTLEVDADTPVRVYETVPDQARIEVFATERLPREQDWTAALADIGLVPADARPTRGPQGSWIYIAQVPGGAPAADRALRRAKMVSARSEAIKNTHDTTWGELASRGDALVVDGTSLAWTRIDWIEVDIPREVPEDALVLLTRERPDGYWYVLPVAGLLVVFMGLFAWALVRSLRRGESRDGDDPAQEIAQQGHEPDPPEPGA